MVKPLPNHTKNIEHRLWSDIDRHGQKLQLSSSYKIMLSGEKDHTVRLYAKHTDDSAIWYTDFTAGMWENTGSPRLLLTHVMKRAALLDALRCATDPSQHELGPEIVLAHTAVEHSYDVPAATALSLVIHIPSIRTTLYHNLNPYIPSPYNSPRDAGYEKKYHDQSHQLAFATRGIGSPTLKSPAAPWPARRFTFQV